MASETVKNLRSAFQEYLKWRQKRYDEIKEMYGNPHALTIHNEIVEILGKEERGESESSVVYYD